MCRIQILFRKVKQKSMRHFHFLPIIFLTHPRVAPSISDMSFSCENRTATQIIVEPPCKKSICNCHCTLMAVLRIGAEQIEMLLRFSDNGRCAVAGHKLDDCKPWNRQCATNFESNKDFLITPPLNGLCGVTRQFRHLRSGQQVIVSSSELFPQGMQPCFFWLCKIITPRENAGFAERPHRGHNTSRA